MSQKPIPKETEILIEVLATIEEIAYAAKQKILQLYQPIETKPATAKTPTITPPTQAPIATFTAKQQHDIEMMFPEDLALMLSFNLKDGYWIIKPKQFLGSENFAKIASTVRGLGGEYVSAGQNSHFKLKDKGA